MSQCDYDVAHLTIEYTDSVEAQCSGLSEEACLVYAKDAPVMYLLDKGRTDDQRTALIVHETAHLLLACSGRSDVDSGHTIADVWGKWVPETAQALAY
jgi:hypothetical protein